MALNSTPLGVHVVQDFSDYTRYLIFNIYNFVKDCSISLEHHERHLDKTYIFDSVIESSKARVLWEKPDILFKFTTAIKNTRFTIIDKKGSGKYH